MYTPTEMIQLICEGHHTLNIEKLNSHVQPFEEAEAVAAEKTVCDELVRKQDAMREEVKQLAAHAFSIEGAFNSVLRGLETAKDTRTMSESLADDTNKLISKWKELREVPSLKTYKLSLIMCNLTGIPNASVEI